MSLVLIHLSDIHLTESSSLKPPEAIAACFREIVSPIKDVVVVLSGDIAFSGQSAEYKVASRYLDNLIKKIKAESRLSPAVVAVPGNHDCHFPSDTSVRDLVLQKIRNQNGECDSLEMLNQCLAVQDEFFQWATSRSFVRAVEIPGRLCWTIEHSLHDGRKIVFQCLNSAWLSAPHEEQGKLFFPIDKIPEISSADLVLAIVHHPYNWIEANNARSLRRTLEETSDIILTGHEHESDIYKKTVQNGPALEYLEGDVFHSNYDENRSGFNLLVIDFDNSRFQVRPYTWDGTRFSLADSPAGEWATFIRNAKRKSRPSEINPDMMSFLRDPGAQLTHRAKTIELGDIFITPNLRRFMRLSSTEGIQQEIVESGFVMNRLFSDRRAYFGGEGPCGKTSMAKMLFLHAIGRGLLPVYLTGEQLTHVEPERVHKIVVTQYCNQYRHPDSDAFVQQPKENKVIIIDDFFGSRLNGPAKTQLCKWLAQNYGYLFVFGGDRGHLEEIVLDLEQGTILSDLIHYEIMEFGHLLREQLIEKWLSLGTEHFVNMEELLHQINQVERTVDTVLGKNLLPSYPIFVLVMLQQHEAGKELRTETGAYGYFYDVLITGALHKTSTSVDDIDAKYNYLGELAWHFYREKIREIERDDLDKFNAAHWDKYRLTGSAEKMFRELTQSRIVVDHAATCAFQYKYIYYYFVARYIHNNLSDSAVVEAIDSLVASLHREESANIIIFLTYLSRDRALIDRILKVARSLFPDTEPCNLEQHIDFLNTAMESVPQFLLPDGDPVQRRKQVLRNMDSEDEKKRATGKPETETDNVENGNKEIEEAFSLNRAFKSIQIMGQILRNFSGSLRGDLKLELAKECFAVGLRALNAYYRLFEKHLDSVVSYLSEMLGKHLEDMPKERRIKTARQISFFWAGMMSFATVKRISSAVGSERLIPTYDDVQRVYDSVATEFVQTAIRMDHSQQFPEKRVIELKRNLEKNVFGQTLLRMLVVEHFYLFPRPYQLQQRVCAQLGIKPSKQMLLGSSERKRKQRKKKKRGRRK